MKKWTILYAVVFLLQAACAVGSIAQAQEVRQDFKKYYDRYSVSGSFIVYDENNDSYTVYNPAQTEQAFIPASTFKICNSLIGLETGVIPDENFMIRWDGVVRQVEAWNADHDMRTAFRNSTVWYYQELARRVGGERMKYWLDKAQYGNADTSGGIGRFWLTGGLRITPRQQIAFLKRLHDNDLPFAQRTMDIVKRIMIMDEKPGYVIRGKTGWAELTGGDIGWYVGYVETKGNVYYFANCVHSDGAPRKDFGPGRIEMVYLMLEELKLISRG